MRVLATTPAVANSEEEEEDDDDDYMLLKKKQNTSDVMFFFIFSISSITIKLKCFSNIIVMGSFNRISDIL